MREFLFYAGVLLLVVCLLISEGATLHKLDQIEQRVDSELATVRIRLDEQDKKIKLYEQYCDDVARCIVEGEW